MKRSTLKLRATEQQRYQLSEPACWWRCAGCDTGVSVAAGNSTLAKERGKLPAWLAVLASWWDSSGRHIICIGQSHDKGSHYVTWNVKKAKYSLVIVDFSNISSFKFKIFHQNQFWLLLLLRLSVWDCWEHQKETFSWNWHCIILKDFLQAYLIHLCGFSGSSAEEMIIFIHWYQTCCIAWQMQWMLVDFL